MTSQAPPSLEDRVAALEQLLGHLIATAREHPVGRKILARLGLS